ncbi:MAG: hypothetical protein PUD09_03855 [Coriobacteriales bacterium]|nr:hypothetical protein [Coriobacteriales bacterium]
MIDQLTVFLPDEMGSLAKMTHVLSGSDIQIHGLMVADASDFSLVRVICDKPFQAYEALSDRSYNVAITQVVAVVVDNVPGGLARVLDQLAGVGCSVQYAYCCSIEGKTVDIIKVEGDLVQEQLRQADFRQLTTEELNASAPTEE